MKQSQFYYLLRRGLFSGGSSIIKNGLVMFNKFTTAGLNFPVQGSAAFNGTSDFIDMGEKNIATDLGITNAFTFGAWANYKEDGDFDGILTMWDNSGSQIFWFGFDSNEKFHYNISLSGGDKARNIVSVPTSEWVYVNLTYNGSNLKLFLNGSNVDTISATGTVDFRGAGLSERLYIGSQTDPFNGNLANVSIWNRALTSDEINSVMWKPYQALSATESNGLQAWYSLDDITSPAASLANMEQLATDQTLVIENKAAITAAINSLS